MIKILHTGDWHIGDFKGPVINSKNARARKTLECLETLIDAARRTDPDFVLISGDIFHQAKVWANRGLDEENDAISAIEELAHNASEVIVMRGTPNHDGMEQFELLKTHFAAVSNVHIVTIPEVVSTQLMDVACIPGFDRGIFRAQHPGLSKEDEDKIFTEEISNICLGLKAQCSDDVPAVLMAHYTVPGCNAESGQETFLNFFEPVLPTEALNAANFDLVCLGHIHRPQQLKNVRNTFYSGAINALNFNDEGQERGFWIHELDENTRAVASEFRKTPYQEFLTINLKNEEIEAINLGNYESTLSWNLASNLHGKIVRVLYECSYDNNKALNKVELKKKLMEGGAFFVREITPKKLSTVADRQDMSNKTDPEENLKKYLCEKGMEETDISKLVVKARDIIDRASASSTTELLSGVFEPVSIEVKNYRNYAEEKFDFSDISFCTINGQNGSGKSSLFMDAIIDCLYEQPREGELTGWIRNDENARSGSISFVFMIGEQTFRVTRTRTRSGKGTLNLSELENGEWTDRSAEKHKDTQVLIEQLIGMDSTTFKACALIMQDQYGLFLQAQKEDRMAILGNLLGLGQYQLMEKLSRDTAKVYGAQMRDAKNAISLHQKTIDSYRDPQSDLIRAQEQLIDLEARQKEVTTRRGEYDYELRTKQAAQEKAEAYKKESEQLNKELDELKSQIDSRKRKIESYDLFLSEEPFINQKADEYEGAVKAKEENAANAALYESGLKQAQKLEDDAKHLETQIFMAQNALALDEKKIADMRLSLAGSKEILTKVEEYKAVAAEYEEESRKEREYSILLGEYSAQVSKIENIQKVRDAEYGAMMATKENLRKKVELLESSGCIDIANAQCEFLKDAKSAKIELDVLLPKMADHAEQEADEIAQAEAEKAEIMKKMEAVGYNAARLSELTEKCAELQAYVVQAEKAKDQEREIAVLEASLAPKQSNISEMQERLSTVKSEAISARSEAESCSEARKAYEDAVSVIAATAEWAQKKQELPLYKERLAHEAELKTADIVTYGQKLDRLGIITAEFEAEEAKAGDILALRDELAKCDEQISWYDSGITELQRLIGAAKQKLDDIEKIKEQISELTDTVNSCALETADYDTLKLAFSQDGIPHQIIRSILPQLTDTANNILGQMTGGNMGVEFKTEKVLKYNSNKEVVTLDILITESGKSTLPYLSKSGGEKVKASLSVILALAELKTTSVGIQLGMLFIDEPPFLDADGIQAYCDALETIQHRYPELKIMAITHDPTMKARFPQSITVVKDDAGSHVHWD